MIKKIMAINIFILAIVFCLFIGPANAGSGYGFSDCVFESNPDGKRVVVTIQDHMSFWGRNITVRLNGITGPDMTSWDTDDRMKAIEARDALYYLCTELNVETDGGQPRIYLKNCERDPDRFGIVADVYVNLVIYEDENHIKYATLNLADALVNMGLAEYK